MTVEDGAPGPRPTYSRRTAIGLGAAALAGAAVGRSPRPARAATTDAGGSATASVLDALRPEIAPREAWGADLPVTGTIVPEDDVRFLLVHHTASTNDSGPADVVEQIRGFHRFHTGPERGWPDVAYNFFVDRFGGIWEARQGSADGPVRGDATGGSQGFALLCSLIGDHSQVPVSAEAGRSLVALLAWLAERHRIDTEPGATVEFVSRGSNRWPAGTEVTAATIAGHRDMSETTCPGRYAYDLLATDLPRAVSDRRLEVAATLTATTAPPPAPVRPAPPPSDGTPTSTGSPPASPEDEEAAPPATDGRFPDLDDLGDVAAPIAVAGGAIAALGAMAARRRRGDDPA